MVRVNDLIPSSSGFANLGVDVDSNSSNAFDITSISPFNHVHQLSGIFHDPLLGQSGIIRYNQATPSFEVSLDGGITFNALITGASTVTSVGVLGDTNLTGDVDFASPASGFIVIEDTSDASPLLWSVDVWGLSGLWGFPSNGFSNIPQCYAATFTAATSWTATHNLNTEDVIVMVLDDSSPRVGIIPDLVTITDSNTVTVSFNVAQAGRIIITGC